MYMRCSVFSSRIFVCFLKKQFFCLLFKKTEKRLFFYWDFLLIYYIHIWYPSSQFWELPSEFLLALQQLILLKLVLRTLFSLGDVFLFISMSSNFELYPGRREVLCCRASVLLCPVRQQQEPRLSFSHQPGRVEPALCPCGSDRSLGHFDAWLRAPLLWLSPF